MHRSSFLTALAFGAVLLGATTPTWAGSAATSFSSSSSSSSSAARTTTVDVSARRWIDVSVATLWTEPGLARSVDAPASSNPADPRQWLSRMTLTQRKWLNGHVETQALYGDEVTLLQSSGEWSKVAVTDQPTPRLAAGYPGWLPTSQLTGVAPAVTPRLARVKKRTTWLFEDVSLTRRVLAVSYGTDLPVAASARRAVEVQDLTGRHVFVASSAVRLIDSGPVAMPVTGRRLVAEARRFLGLQYLWGGTSGFGFDCSGFTHAVHAQLGVIIPRDAGPQYSSGAPVARADLRRGDLVFFRNSSGIHHVGMYVGGGRMIHSPRTGRPIAIVSLGSQPWAREFAGGRRYVG